MKLSKEVKVGLLATAALTMIYLGVNFLKGREVFSSNNTYYTIYDHSRGLGTSSPVLINGIPVGRIKSIRILADEDYRALVTFETKKEIRLTDATKARLVSYSLLGAKAIELLIEKGNPLKNHDTVPGETEQGIEEAFAESALPTLHGAKDISLLANQFLANLVENTDKINAIFTNIEATTLQLKQVMSENQKGLNTFRQNLTEVSDAFSDSKNGVRPLLTKLNRLMEGVKDEEVKDAAAKLNNILGNVEKVLAKIEQGENSLSKLLYNDNFYNNLNQTLGNLDKLLIDLKIRPWRYVNFSIWGKKRGHEEAEKE